MQLNTNLILSDRLVFDPNSPSKLRVANSFWDWCKRIISWICAPTSYRLENIRAVACFKKYLIDTLGEDRLQRICSHYSMKLELDGSPLLSRDVAKIVIGAQKLNVADIGGFQNLDAETLAKRVAALKTPFTKLFEVPEITSKISGRPTEWLAAFRHDPFLADREWLQVCLENPSDHMETFIHNLVARVIKRDMSVGTLVPAPNHSSGRAQFYYVSARLVTGEGMVSYVLHPATRDTDLEPIRLFRGTSPRSSELDAISTVITDLDKDLGRRAYLSGEIYEHILQQKGLQVKVEAGHSLGSTLVQYRLANRDHIKKAYLYCGPGLPMEDVEKFNRKQPNVNLFIRHAKHDSFSRLGDAHLGYKASQNTKVDFWKYHPSQTKKLNESVHVAVWGRERSFYGIEGGLHPEYRDDEFFNRDRLRERARKIVGPAVSLVLRAARAASRSCFSSRTLIERGLKIGHFVNGHWRVDHFRSI